MPNNTILDETYAALLAHIAALETDKRQDFILAWDWGRGVKFEEGKTTIVRLYEASSVKLYSEVTDGNSTLAYYIRRDHAITAYLLSLRWRATKIKASIDQHNAAIAEKTAAFTES